MSQSSTPTLSDFDPTLIPMQHDVVSLVRKGFDYSKGSLEILLSGSVGSAKSILMAHLAVTHCLLNKRARFLLGRRALPDLKSTLILKILEHVEGTLVLNEDYSFKESTGEFYFPATGSEIISRSWADKNFMRFRSLELSAFAIEELTENDGEYWNFYKELFSRLGRLPHVEECFGVSATNPDAPSHPAYEHFILNQNERRKVFYSLTEENPFLPKWYIKQLLETFTEKEADRMLRGKWIEIATEVIYYAFEEKNNVIDSYVINPNYPILICYDFNIGIGKPMSACAMQYINGNFFIFDENIIEGANTQDSIDNWIDKLIFTKSNSFVIHGDASGFFRSTNYNKVDYDIIRETLDKMGVSFSIDVKRHNPPVRERHITVNGLLRNAIGESHLFVTRNCKTVIKGLRLSRLKKGSQYIENDSDPFQHVTTALGYGIMRQKQNEKNVDRYSRVRH